MRTNPNFHQIWITMEKMFVQWALHLPVLALTLETRSLVDHNGIPCHNILRASAASAECQVPLHKIITWSNRGILRASAPRTEWWDKAIQCALWLIVSKLLTKLPHSRHGMNWWRAYDFYLAHKFHENIFGQHAQWVLLKHIHITFLRWYSAHITLFCQT